MFEKKNQAVVLIEDCCQCPSSTLKAIKEEHKYVMFCQTETSCIRLRDIQGWSECPIPDWCPRLKQNQPKIYR